MAGEARQSGRELARVESGPSAALPSQMADLPKDELEALAETFGIDPTCHRTRQALVAAIHDRRQMIAGLDREAMLDVVRWARRPVSISATREALAHEIALVRSMRFAGLSQRGLIVLARMRGLRVTDDEQVPILIKQLKKQEGVFTKLNRKRRALLGSIVSNMIGEDEETYQYVPPGPGAAGQASGPSATHPPREASIKEDIEESGIFGGIAGRIKKSADQYLNRKLDEIESRIDRKLDEIDHRLAEWRDKEIANRIRILKITLWASVIVSLMSLIYLYLKQTFGW